MRVANVMWACALSVYRPTSASGGIAEAWYDTSFLSNGVMQLSERPALHLARRTSDRPVPFNYTISERSNIESVRISVPYQASTMALKSLWHA